MPDHSTLWRFREQLAKSGLEERAFALITTQIEKSGFVLNGHIDRRFADPLGG